MDPDAPRGTQGRQMMLRRLRLYLWWKSKLSERKQDDKPQAMPDFVRALSGVHEKSTGKNDGLSEALRKKDQEKAERSARRRRVRGAPPVLASGNERPRPVKLEEGDLLPGEGEMRVEADKIAQLWVTRNHVWS